MGTPFCRFPERWLPKKGILRTPPEGCDSQPAINELAWGTERETVIWRRKQSSVDRLERILVRKSSKMKVTRTGTWKSFIGVVGRKA